jgi:dopamine beta-monooxygenase
MLIYNNHYIFEVWTRELCMKNSDGDGKTNGQELGDPHCTWTKGEIPTHTNGLSHPGKNNCVL